VPELNLFPERGSDLARRVDDLTIFALAVAAFFSLLIAGLLFYFGLKYRRRSPNEVGISPARATTSLEVAWSVIPLGIVLFLFGWGADVFFTLARPPSNAVQYFVIGRQWMWKIQHPDGRREINELHVPVGQAVKLTMTSEDVIHSFFVPAFRTKMDVLPGRYTTLWFKADKVGVFPLYCAEYCGTEHSRMIGRVVVMDLHHYEEWLSGGPPERSAAASGEAIFQARGCPSCHRPDTTVRAPQLTGLLGKKVELKGGEAVIADESYIRESILEPAAKVVAGYEPVMPANKGQISEDDLVQLISYIASQKGGAPALANSGNQETERPAQPAPPMPPTPPDGREGERK
jgi:cytochrome c oxidase subunit 2